MDISCSEDQSMLGSNIICYQGVQEIAPYNMTYSLYNMQSTAASVNASTTMHSLPSNSQSENLSISGRFAAHPTDGVRDIELYDSSLHCDMPPGLQCLPPPLINDVSSNGTFNQQIAAHVETTKQLYSPASSTDVNPFPIQHHEHSNSSPYSLNNFHPLSSEVNKFINQAESQYNDMKALERPIKPYSNCTDCNDTLPAYNAGQQNFSELPLGTQPQPIVLKETSKDVMDEGPVICQWDACNQEHSSVSELVQHIEKNHIEKNMMDDYICLWRNCPRKQKPFNARYKLVIHMRIHSGEKPNKCNYPGCTKAFSRLENLKIHMRTHTGEKPYICQFQNCSKSFSNSSDRSKHQKTHYEQKPYACNYPGCDKRYTDPSSLRKHTRIHSQTKKPQNDELLTGFQALKHHSQVPTSSGRKFKKKTLPAEPNMLYQDSLKSKTVMQPSFVIEPLPDHYNNYSQSHNFSQQQSNSNFTMHYSPATAYYAHNQTSCSSPYHSPAHTFYNHKPFASNPNSPSMQNGVSPKPPQSSSLKNTLSVEGYGHMYDTHHHHHQQHHLQLQDLPDPLLPPPLYDNNSTLTVLLYHQPSTNISSCASLIDTQCSYEQSASYYQ